MQKDGWAGYYECCSPRVLAPNGVSLKQHCAVCSFRNLGAEDKPAYVAQHPQPENRKRGPCMHLGPPTGERVDCRSCQGRVLIKLLACAEYGLCTTEKQLDGIRCCATCPDHVPV